MARNTQPPEGDPVVPDPENVDPSPEIPTDPPALEALTVPELQEQAQERGVEITDGSGAGGNVVNVDELHAQRQAALDEAEQAQQRANDLSRQIAAANGPDELQAAGLPPLIQVAEASAAAVTNTPVED